MLTPERAGSDAKSGPVILVRETASPDDIAGIDVASGLLTARVIPRGSLLLTGIMTPPHTLIPRGG